MLESPSPYSNLFKLEMKNLLSNSSVLKIIRRHTKLIQLQENSFCCDSHDLMKRDCLSPDWV